MNNKDSFPKFLYGVKFQGLIPVHYPMPGKLYRAVDKEFPVNDISLFRCDLPHGIIWIPNRSIVMYIEYTENDEHKVLYRDTIGLLLSEVKMQRIDK